MIHFIVYRFIKNTGAIVISILSCFTMGWLLTKNVDFFPNDPHADFWFICEGIFLYSFYQIGILIKKLKLIEREIAIIPEVILLLIFGVILFFTFDLNQGPWKVTQKVPVVLINILQHGNPFYCIISALSGFSNGYYGLR